MPERFIHSSHERDVSTKYHTGSEYPTSDQFQMSHSFTSALRGEAGHDPGWFHLGFVWDMCSGTHWVPTRINLVNLGLRIVLWPQRTCPSHKRWSWLSFPTADMGLETQQVEREDLKPGSTSEVIKFWQVGLAENTNFLSNVLPQDLPRPSQHPLQDSPAASTQSTSGFGSKWITWHLVALTSILLGELLEFGTESVEFDSKRAPHLSLVRAVGTSSK